MATSEMCSSFCEVDDLTSVRRYPSFSFSSTSIATKVSSAMKVASKIAGAPASSAFCVAATRSAPALWGRSISTPPGYRSRAASPTRRPWSKRSWRTLSGCSSLASGSCTSHHSFLWHWRPEVKRDLERRGADVAMAFTLAPRCDRGPGVRSGKWIRALQGSKHQHLLRPGAPVGEVLERTAASALRELSVTNRSGLHTAPAHADRAARLRDDAHHPLEIVQTLRHVLTGFRARDRIAHEKDADLRALPLHQRPGESEPIVGTLRPVGGIVQDEERSPLR